MGYLTSVNFYNDALGDIEADPKAFGEAILEAMNRANYSGESESGAVGCHANALTVEPSRHADDVTVFVHYGNSVLNLNPWNKDFKNLLSRPNVAEAYLKAAENTVKYAREALNEAKKDAKKAGLL
jgi:hypothetical protein